MVLPKCPGNISTAQYPAAPISTWLTDTIKCHSPRLRLTCRLQSHARKAPSGQNTVFLKALISPFFTHTSLLPHTQRLLKDFYTSYTATHLSAHGRVSIHNLYLQISCFWHFTPHIQPKHQPLVNKPAPPAAAAESAAWL